MAQQNQVIMRSNWGQQTQHPGDEAKADKQFEGGKFKLRSKWRCTLKIAHNKIARPQNSPRIVSKCMILLMKIIAS